MEKRENVNLIFQSLVLITLMIVGIYLFFYVYEEECRILDKQGAEYIQMLEKVRYENN